MATLTSLIDEFYSIHETVSEKSDEEDRILAQIVEAIHHEFEHKKVRVIDGYIIINNFTRITEEHIQKLQTLGLNKYFIDTDINVVTHYLKIPTYYNNLSICISIDDMR